MDKKQVKNIAKFAIKGLGTYGFVRTAHLFVPINATPIERIACETAVIFAGLAFSDMMENQFLKADEILNQIANGNGQVIAM